MVSRALPVVDRWNNAYYQSLYNVWSRLFSRTENKLRHFPRQVSNNRFLLEYCYHIPVSTVRWLPPAYQYFPNCSHPDSLVDMVPSDTACHLPFLLICTRSSFLNEYQPCMAKKANYGKFSDEIQLHVCMIDLQQALNWHESRCGVPFKYQKLCLLYMKPNRASYQHTVWWTLRGQTEPFILLAAVILQRPKFNCEVCTVLGLFFKKWTTLATNGTLCLPPKYANYCVWSIAWMIRFWFESLQCLDDQILVWKFALFG